MAIIDTDLLLELDLLDLLSHALDIRVVLLHDVRG